MPPDEHPPKKWEVVVTGFVDRYMAEAFAAVLRRQGATDAQLDVITREATFISEFDRHQQRGS